LKLKPCIKVNMTYTSINLMKSTIDNFTAFDARSVALFLSVKYIVDTFWLIHSSELFSLLKVPFFGGNK